MTTNGIQILTLSLDISKTESLLSTISIITTVAGTGAPGGYVEGTGPATSATLNEPYGVASDALGNFYIADTDNHVIRLVTKIGGLITTVAGTGGPGGYTGDLGPATAAKLNSPSGVTLDASGNVYIADTNNHVIRLVPKTRKSTPPSPKAPKIPKAPKAPKCDKKSKTCAQEISEEEVNDTLVNSVVSEFPALRRS